MSEQACYLCPPGQSAPVLGICVECRRPVCERHSHAYQSAKPHETATRECNPCVMRDMELDSLA